MQKQHLIESVLNHLNETADTNFDDNLKESKIFKWNKKSKLFGQIEIIDPLCTVNHVLSDHTYRTLENLMTRFLKFKFDSTVIVLDEKSKVDILNFKIKNATNDEIMKLADIRGDISDKSKFSFEVFSNKTETYIKIDGREINDPAFEKALGTKIKNTIKLLNLNLSETDLNETAAVNFDENSVIVRNGYNQSNPETMELQAILDKELSKTFGRKYEEVQVDVGEIKGQGTFVFVYNDKTFERSKVPVKGTQSSVISKVKSEVVYHLQSMNE